MKNLLFIIAIAFGAGFTNIQASNYMPTLHSHTVTTAGFVVEVNLLCTSIAKGDTEVVKKLVANGANVNQKSNGLTPAMYAAKYNRVEILEFLIAQGANLKVKCNKGYTILEYAIATNSNEAQVIIENALEN